MAAWLIKSWTHHDLRKEKGDARLIILSSLLRCPPRRNGGGLAREKRGKRVIAPQTGDCANSLSIGEYRGDGVIATGEREARSRKGLSREALRNIGKRTAFVPGTRQWEGSVMFSLCRTEGWRAARRGKVYKKKSRIYRRCVGGL